MCQRTMSCSVVNSNSKRVVWRKVLTQSKMHILYHAVANVLYRHDIACADTHLHVSMIENRFVLKWVSGVSESILKQIVHGVEARNSIALLLCKTCQRSYYRNTYYKYLYYRFHHSNNLFSVTTRSSRYHTYPATSP